MVMGKANKSKQEALVCEKISFFTSPNQHRHTNSKRIMIILCKKSFIFEGKHKMDPSEKNRWDFLVSAEHRRVILWPGGR